MKRSLRSILNCLLCLAGVIALSPSVRAKSTIQCGTAISRLQQEVEKASDSDPVEQIERSIQVLKDKYPLETNPDELDAVIIIERLLTEKNPLPNILSDFHMSSISELQESIKNVFFELRRMVYSDLLLNAASAEEAREQLSFLFEVPEILGLTNEKSEIDAFDFDGNSPAKAHSASLLVELKEFVYAKLKTHKMSIDRIVFEVREKMPLLSDFDESDVYHLMDDLVLDWSRVHEGRFPRDDDFGWAENQVGVTSAQFHHRLLDGKQISRNQIWLNLARRALAENVFFDFYDKQLENLTPKEQKDFKSLSQKLALRQIEAYLLRTGSSWVKPQDFGTDPHQVGIAYSTIVPDVWRVNKYLAHKDGWSKRVRIFEGGIELQLALKRAFPEIYRLHEVPSEQMKTATADQANQVREFSKKEIIPLAHKWFMSRDRVEVIQAGDLFGSDEGQIRIPRDRAISNASGPGKKKWAVWPSIEDFYRDLRGYELQNQLPVTSSFHFRFVRISDEIKSWQQADAYTHYLDHVFATHEVPIGRDEFIQSEFLPLQPYTLFGRASRDGLFIRSDFFNTLKAKLKSDSRWQNLDPELQEKIEALIEIVLKLPDR